MQVIVLCRLDPDDLLNLDEVNQKRAMRLLRKVGERPETVYFALAGYTSFCPEFKYVELPTCSALVADFDAGTVRVVSMPLRKLPEDSVKLVAFREYMRKFAH